MAWQEIIIQECTVVFYFDGYLSRNGKKTREYLQAADLIRSTPTGLAQYVAPRKATHTLLNELQYIS
jgi:16S rRNA C1402 (ribose-2'-O) methylase RsmI